jgi:tungstate transport system substrate-binding protein
VLIPAFEATAGGTRVKIIAVGSGEALALGRRRDADVLLVHSPADEESFMAAGHGVRRLPVMSNDYVIVGPSADPAGVRQAANASAALQAIAAAGAAFISRGDSSGTHRRELQLWQQAGVRPETASFRIDIGQGMGETLNVASERAAYTLTDRSTYQARRTTLDLDILLEGGAELLNRYSVITVAGARQAAAADAFATWLVSEQGAAVIRAFGVDRFGAPLFVPAADTAASAQNAAGSAARTGER